MQGIATKAANVVHGPRTGAITIEDTVHEATRLLQAGALADAEALCRDTLAARGDDPGLLHVLGLVFAHGGKGGAAADAIEKSLALDGANADAHYNLGVVLESLDRRDDAIAAWRRATAIRPGYRAASGNLGLALTKAGRFDDALSVYEGALRHHGEDADFLFWAGNALSALRHGEKARTYYEKATRARPDFVEAWHFLGLAARDAGDAEDAVRCQERAIELRPDFADAHFERAQALLTVGDFGRGFAEYEWRWKRPQTPPRTFRQPPWDDGDPAGKNILLYTEQGAGDAIQFVRYAPLVAGQGATVTVACHENLLKVFSGCEGVSRVVPLFDEPSDFDCHAPLMSLPGRFGTTLETIPDRVPYIAVPPASGLPSLENRETTMNVGIVWSGNPRQPNNHNRACPVRLLARLTGIDGTAFFSLQVGEKAHDLAGVAAGAGIVDLSPHLADFADTAAVIGRLDLVITVDTAVAHLAGALARPVWLLLSYAADWRWLQDRDDSPWYPTMRLFRQPRPGDWEPVIAEVQAALEESSKPKRR